MIPGKGPSPTEGEMTGQNHHTMQRMCFSFENLSKLFLVGFCGSNKTDPHVTTTTHTRALELEKSKFHGWLHPLMDPKLWPKNHKIVMSVAQHKIINFHGTLKGVVCVCVFCL